MPLQSNASLRLLLRDREELDRVGLILRGSKSALAFIVCAESLRAMARAYLNERSGERTIAEPVHLLDPEHTLRLLTEGAEVQANAVLSLSIDEGATEVLRTLNWHREKLRRGSSVVLWISGTDGLRALRDVAPDAYAWRDVVAIIRGDSGPLVAAPAKESGELRRARKKLDRARNARERAAAVGELASRLRQAGRREECVRIARRALEGLPEELYQEDGDRELRAKLHLQIAAAVLAGGRQAEPRRLILDGLEQLRGITSPEARDLRLWLQAALPGPNGPDRSSKEAALEVILRERPLSAVHAEVLRRLSSCEIRRGDLRAAASLLEEAASVSTKANFNTALIASAKASLEVSSGRLVAAEEQLRSAASLLVEADASAEPAALTLAHCLRLRGEMEAARTLLEGLLPPSEARHLAHPSIFHELGMVLIEAGEVNRGLELLRDAVRHFGDVGCDHAHFLLSAQFVTAITECYLADRIGIVELIAADAEMEVAEDISLTMVGIDPPWYRILFPGLRSVLLALRPDQLSDAIVLAERALEQARAVCVELAPMEASVYVGHLVRAGRLDDALAVLTSAEAEAEQQSNLRELADIQRLSLLSLVRLRRPAPLLEAKMTALRGTLNATGSSRIAADKLLDLGRELPPDSTSPDPVALVEEAHALFLDMPMPAGEARCLEVLGDILAARGHPVEARRRYIAARRRLERYGLGLRLPLLVSKLERLMVEQQSHPKEDP
jgi:tetratricopeptide (TPR) repeat protein